MISCLEVHIQSFLFYAYKHKTLTEVPFGGGTLSRIILNSLFSSDMFGCPGPETNVVIKSDFYGRMFYVSVQKQDIWIC